MAHQINKAVDFLVSELQFDNTHTWLQLINIDSRISAAGIHEIQYHINQGSPILLQSAVFFGNQEDLRWLTTGCSIYQSRRSLVEEQYRLLCNRYISNRKLYHVVGH
ncbi:MAG: hypothetical protein H6765_00130 [Candidatus Peribacteria bacterium]|nr:MAG: hypothetical protein H6765_00130 [Candidatus Peribacteria bacterium]